MKRGIDVSVFQGGIEWDKVKADGIEFAMIKATQGRSEQNAAFRLFTDSCFIRNITGARAAGVRIGVYHYLTAETVPEAMEEASYFLSVIAPYRGNVGLYAAVDVESRYLPQDKQLLTQIVHTFCARVQAEGYTPMIYTNPTWLRTRLGDIGMWPLWLALWRNKANVPSAEDYPNIRIWQWGAENVDGIAGDVDADFMITEKQEENYDESKQEDKPMAKDNKPAAWAAEAVKWAQDNGILLGDENGNLMLGEGVTREQMCVFLRRVYDKAVEDAAERVAERLIAALGGNADGGA
ncbi:MAG: S-layer homology domain-containing protein [Clostridia bacterium]|nr:S-layer homology domain-containing protein [Clostridia bacterium]